MGMNEEKGDPVNHPAHYTSHPSGVERIDVARHHDFCIGNCIKYIWRAGAEEVGGDVRQGEGAGGPEEGQVVPGQGDRGEGARAGVRPIGQAAYDRPGRIAVNTPQSISLTGG